ncbi:MAG: type II toxin-antitoxin system HicA family toxin [Alphaproteobacteria bacterium]|nr:type II toxin-antitoxin system HicA family toxin [Alphaproteobacteria bacterium]
MGGGRLPAVNGKQVIRALGRVGFVVNRTSGSHHMLAHISDPARMVIVPMHGNHDIKAGTLRSILKQAGLTVEQFKELL